MILRRRFLATSAAAALSNFEAGCRTTGTA